MAIINGSHKFIFVHVPKAAGTAITLFLANFSAERDQEIGVTERGDRIELLFQRHFGVNKHSTALEIHQFVGPSVWEYSFTFAFVRNPFSRAYSLFRFLKDRWRAWPGSGIMDRLNNFEKFVQSDFFATDGPVGLFRPQWAWLQRETGNRPLVDFIGRIETIEDDMKKVISSIRMPLDPSTVFDSTNRINASTEPEEWAQHLGEQVRQRIIYRYRVDFERLGYATDYERFGDCGESL